MRKAELQDKIILEKLDYFRKILYNMKRDIFGISDDDNGSEDNLMKEINKLKKTMNIMGKKK